MTQGRVRPPAHDLALTVHGPAGALDMVVPASAAVTDVAREYAAQTGLVAIPLLYSRSGRLLAASAGLSDVGVDVGDILVAATGVHRAAPPRGDRPGPERTRNGRSEPRSERARTGAPGPHPIAVLWCSVAASVAALGGWSAAGATPGEHDLTIGLLAAAALLGLVPVGPSVVPRLLAAPCFLGAAGFAWAWDPAPERLPMVLGVTAASVAVGAALARALAAVAEAQLRVVVVAGGLVFVVTGALTLLGWSPRVTWAVLLAGALVSARFVPMVAVDVPDQYLVDVERLAVTAWSARDRSPRRRVRSIVPVRAVADVADRGGRLLATAAGAVAAVTLLSAPLLVWTATLPVDRVGARLEVALVGAGLLLAARSYRHPVARGLLRVAGLGSWAPLAAYAAPRLTAGELLTVSLVAIGLGLVLVGVAVATGRGWRSAWWSRRAEVAEALCGSSALAVVLIASGFFRQLWESTS